MTAYRFLVAAVSAVALLAQDEEPGKIMRPANKSSHPVGLVDIVATAPAGKLTLDGKAVDIAQPFPDVFHGAVKASSGEHILTLTWEGGRKEIRFFVGANPPPDFSSFRQHPPLADVQCTQCHEQSARGRFRFKGGCFDCHKQEGFVKVHTHPITMLEQCGTCHNAHGSTVKSHLIYSKETSCKLCHE